MGKLDETKKFILEDLARVGPHTANPETTSDWFKDSRLKEFKERFWGKMIINEAGNQYTEIDITGPPGYTTGVYYPFLFWARRQGYQTEKADESIHVTPMHSAYYQVTMKQKEDLEAKIKAGIASAAQAVSDFELLSHDKRKYEEFLRYYGYRTKKELDKMANKKPEIEPDDYNELDLSEADDKVLKRTDEHALKAFFIDYVDQHTGDVSLRNIVQRWPTIITDFMKLREKHKTVDDIKNDLGVTRAEGVVLLTKNKLYEEWKKMFFPQVKSRYDRIKQLLLSRKTSIDQYREWVKPYVAKHQLIKESLESSGGREGLKTLFVTPAGQAVSMSSVEIWMWKNFQSQEYYLAPGETIGYNLTNPYDEWTQNELVWNPNYGLVASHPWITKKWVDSTAKEIMNSTWMVPFRQMYVFVIVKYDKTNIRMPDGFELEDGVFNFNTMLMSQNVLLAKLLELRAKRAEFEKYINDLLGIPSDFAQGEKVSYVPPKYQFLRDIPILGDLTFFKRGPYEPTFKDRITKSYLIPMSRTVFGPLTGKVKSLAGYGKD